MKIVGYETGRAYWLVPIEELRPLQGLSLTRSIGEVVAKYQFRESPDASITAEQLGSGPLSFKGGVADSENGEVFIASLDIYTDAIVADAYETTQAEWLLQDFMQWGQGTLGLRSPIRAPKKSYFAQIIVEFVNDVSTLVAPWSSVIDRLFEIYNDLYGVSIAPGLNRLSLECDKMALPPRTVSTDFTIERRANHPFEENRFWCQAAIHTEQLIQLLEHIDELAAK